MEKTTAERLNEIDARLDEIENNTRIAAKDVLDIDEAVVYTGFAKGHLFRLTSRRLIPHYKVGRCLRFDKEVLHQWLTQNRVKTQDEIEAEADEYLSNRGQAKRVLE